MDALSIAACCGLGLLVVWFAINGFVRRHARRVASWNFELKLKTERALDAQMELVEAEADLWRHMERAPLLHAERIPVLIETLKRIEAQHAARLTDPDAPAPIWRRARAWLMSAPAPPPVVEQPATPEPQAPELERALYPGAPATPAPSAAANMAPDTVTLTPTGVWIDGQLVS